MATNGYTHYRLIGSAYVPVGGDSYTKSEINQMLANGYMKLLDPSMAGMRVPADGDAPDMTDDAYEALPVGQIFICVINDEPTYWIKQDDRILMKLDFRLTLVSWMMRVIYT